MGSFGQAKLWDLQLTSQMVGTQWSCADFVWMVERKSPWRFPQWRGEDLLASRLRLLLDLIAKRALSFSEQPHPAPETDEGGCRNFEIRIRSLRQKQRAVLSNKDIPRPPKKPLEILPKDPSGSPGGASRPSEATWGPQTAPRGLQKGLQGHQKAPQGAPKGPYSPQSTHHFTLLGFTQPKAGPNPAETPKPPLMATPHSSAQKHHASSTLFYFKSRLITARCTNSKGPSTRFSQFPPPFTSTQPWAGRHPTGCGLSRFCPQGHVTIFQHDTRAPAGTPISPLKPSPVSNPQPHSLTPPPLPAAPQGHGGTLQSPPAAGAAAGRGAAALSDSNVGQWEAGLGPISAAPEAKRVKIGWRGVGGLISRGGGPTPLP